jgi:Integrase core domain
MDGKGRYMDNIFVERLWRSLKYEEVYLNAYASVAEAKVGIGSWLGFYNKERQHQSLGYRTPRQACEAPPHWWTPLLSSQGAEKVEWRRLVVNIQMIQAGSGGAAGEQRSE